MPKDDRAGKCAYPNRQISLQSLKICLRGDRSQANLLTKALNLLLAETFNSIWFVRASSTRAYESDWRIFIAWCAVKALPVLPATSNTLVRFITEQARAGIAPSTLDRRLAAIRFVHLQVRLPSWRDAIEVTAAMRTIRHEWRRPPARKAAAVDEEVRCLADAVEWGYLRAHRDRALVLLGFAGALRGSDLMALDVEHIDERSGYLLLWRWSGRTDYASGSRNFWWITCSAARPMAL